MKIVLLFLAYVFCSLIAFQNTANAIDRGYLFKLDDRSIQPLTVSLHGTPDQLQPGDLVCIAGLWITLGKEKQYVFETSSYPSGRLFQRLPGGEMRLIGLEAIELRDHEIPEGVKRPPGQELTWLDTLTSDELRGLRGIEISSWNKATEKQFQHLDLTSACITLNIGFGNILAGKLPNLPKNIEYLYIRESSNDTNISGYRALRRFKGLKSLKIDIMGEELDCDIFKGLPLAYLSLRSTSNLQNIAALGQLKKLRVLDLWFEHELKDLEFARSLHDLRVLNIEHTLVEDLQPLQELPELATVKASASEIKQLPEQGFPALQRLELLATAVTEANVTAFTQTHPKCQVHVRWEPMLKAALRGADRIRVKSSNDSGFGDPTERTLFEEHDAEKVRAIIDKIHINEPVGGTGACGCTGNPKLEFYEKDVLLLQLGFAHRLGLKWQDWPGDVALTEESAESVHKWLDSRGK